VQNIDFTGDWMISARSHYPASFAGSGLRSGARSCPAVAGCTFFGDSQHHRHRQLKAFLVAPKMSTGFCDATAVVEES
jgi:hypothetical protein